ncbi:MAG: ankyrin repeat domain-containing protein [Rickettsiales bacterium]|nr:ankyrin repeat domain-containing protein [Rickettsiales bacterium]
MELKKFNNTLSVKKTDEDFLEQINSYKQAADIQKHNDTVIKTISDQQCTLGDVPKRRPTAIEAFMKKHTADIKKYDDKIARILAAAKDINGNTLLYYAAQEGNLYLARLLVKEDADVNTKDNEGLTPLHAAASSNVKDVAEFLVDKGTDVNAKEVNNWIPLHFAAHSNAKDVAELLVNKGADVDARNI